MQNEKPAPEYVQSCRGKLSRRRYRRTADSLQKALCAIKLDKRKDAGESINDILAGNTRHSWILLDTNEYLVNKEEQDDHGG